VVKVIRSRLAGRPWFFQRKGAKIAETAKRNKDNYTLGTREDCELWWFARANHRECLNDLVEVLQDSRQVALIESQQEAKAISVAGFAEMTKQLQAPSLLSGDAEFQLPFERCELGIAGSARVKFLKLIAEARKVLGEEKTRQVRAKSAGTNHYLAA
jgi:hypothetical protein